VSQRLQLRVDRDAQAVINAWLNDDNHHRPHSALGHLTPSDYAERRQQPTSEAARLQLDPVGNGGNVTFWGPPQPVLEEGIATWRVWRRHKLMSRLGLALIEAAFLLQLVATFGG
jgi:hypothetical protein